MNIFKPFYPFDTKYKFFSPINYNTVIKYMPSSLPLHHHWIYTHHKCSNYNILSYIVLKLYSTPSLNICHHHCHYTIIEYMLIIKCSNYNILCCVVLKLYSYSYVVETLIGCFEIIFNFFFNFDMHFHENIFL